MTMTKRGLMNALRRIIQDNELWRNRTTVELTDIGLLYIRFKGGKPNTGWDAPASETRFHDALWETVENAGYVANAIYASCDAFTLDPVTQD